MTFYFGLNINRNMTDIEDPLEALKNVNLDPKDLARIRGTTDPGNVSRSDFKNLSGLTVDFEKAVGSLSSETSNYDNLTTNFYNEQSGIDNNLTINGQFAASAIKYKYLEETTNIIKTADISTSRVSSWSSFSNDAGAPIFYGGEVRLEGTLELSDLTITQPAERKRFESEIPTHRIEVEINGESIYLLAMKGIPLVFRGFFRNATELFAVVNVLNGLRPSWIIKNTGDSGEYVFENVLVSSSSQITFRDTQAKQRDIYFYYPVDNITNLNLPSLSISELPTVVLPNLNSLNIAGNDFREIPNFSEFTNLQTLSVQGNNLTRSFDSELQRFNTTVANRLPPNLRTLNIGNCFSGPYTADISSRPLVSLNIDTSYYGRRLTGTSPAVNGSTIENYSIGANAFSDVHVSVKNSTSLKSINLSDNGISSTNVYFNSSNLETFNSNSNSRHNVVDLSGKSKLKTYNSTYLRPSGNSSITSIFNGCTSLSTISLYAASVNGAFPALVGCNSLASLDLRFTGITDALPSTTIGENTFDSCRNTLAGLYVRSSNFTAGGSFHPDCFRLMSALSYVEFTSNSQGISGSLPDFSTARNIAYLLMYSNRLEGLIPNFTNNDRIFFINLVNNSFTGNVPNVPHPSLQHLILTNNQLEIFEKIDSTSILRIHLDYNRIKRIPDLSNLTNLQELLLNNQRLNGQSLRYTAESFIGLRALRNVNLANNAINQGTIDQIILDCSANYDNNPRRGVTVNLRGNASPSTNDEIQSAITKLQTVGWRLLYDL
jgi:hypothetical protein